MEVCKQVVKFFILIFLVILVNSCSNKERDDRIKEIYIAYGKASYYSNYFNGKRTSSGHLYNSDSLTAAHRTLPFNTILKVTNLENDSTVKVKVTDRGPYIGHRLIDLSLKAARQLHMVNEGVVKVRIEKISK